MSTTSAGATSPETRNWSAWQIDTAHSLVEFSVRHMMISNVKGGLTWISGTVVDAGEDPKLSSVKAAIDVTTLITGDPQRDEHLRSADFFDAANYPTMTFESRRASGSSEEFTVIGDLTIHGQTREVTLDVTFTGTGTNPLGQTVAGFTAETKINRKDFGLNWNMALEAGGFLVGDEAKVSIELTFPWVLRVLRVHGDGAEEQEEASAREVATQAERDRIEVWRRTGLTTCR